MLHVEKFKANFLHGDFYLLINSPTCFDLVVVHLHGALNFLNMCSISVNLYGRNSTYD